MLSWHRIDTVMLDMDGTLLDLYFDNLLWNELLPELYARARGMTVEAARSEIYHDLKEIRHTLEFYCLDHWCRRTQLDILGLHREITHLIQFRPDAEAFLDTLATSSRRVILVTNAHPDALALKNEVTHLADRMDGLISSHQFNAPKEDQSFWQDLSRVETFDPARTLFIDDTQAVLDAAHEYGIGHLLCVTQPDSQRPPRTDLGYPAFNHFNEIMPAL